MFSFTLKNHMVMNYTTVVLWWVLYVHILKQHYTSFSCTWEDIRIWEECCISQKEDPGCREIVCHCIELFPLTGPNDFATDSPQNGSNKNRNKVTCTQLCVFVNKQVQIYKATLLWQMLSHFWWFLYPNRPTEVLSTLKRGSMFVVEKNIKVFSNYV